MPIAEALEIKPEVMRGEIKKGAFGLVISTPTLRRGVIPDHRPGGPQRTRDLGGVRVDDPGGVRRGD